MTNPTDDTQGKHEGPKITEPHSRSSSNPLAKAHSQEQLRCTTGYNKHSFGGFSSDQPASATQQGDPGYNDNRDQDFPEESAIGVEYEQYKILDARKVQACTEYNDLKDSLASLWKLPRTAEDRKNHRKLAELADTAAEYSKRVAEARRNFNQRHIGRRSKSFAKGHITQSKEIERAEIRLMVKAEHHDRWTLP